MRPTGKTTLRSEWLILAALAVIAILVRLVGLQQKNHDIDLFEGWYHQLLAAGRWHGLGKEIGNYNAPFLYVLMAAGLVPGPLIVKIKTIWMLFDVVLVWFTYKTVDLAWPGRRVALGAALVMAFLPTVVINASYYGQIDAMWACFALGGVYFLLRGRPWWGVSLCTVALAVKPQGIFIFPLLGLLALMGRIPWRSLLAVPAVYVALDIPAFLAGRNPIELLTIYSPRRQDHWISGLTWRAPSIYAFIPASSDQTQAIKNLGYVFTAAVILGLYYVFLVRKVELTRQRIVQAAALFSILVPFFLPGMHERYFYLADVMSLVLVFYRPRLWFVPLLVQASSLMAYQGYLFHNRSMPLPIAAAFMLAALLVVGYDLLSEAVRRPGRPEELDSPAEPEQPAADRPESPAETIGLSPALPGGAR